MAEHHSGPVEVGASMDYAEHEKTYNGFLFAAKYGTMMLVVLLICMAVGFFTAAGFVFSTLLFVVLTALGFYLL
ncbi:MAG: aa3-type cytochrome c oxidase subunit IV [Rhizobium sp.]|nr:aa3-type cytochrome c oxidase subunit IV [Rhizobium sp.]